MFSFDTSFCGRRSRSLNGPRGLFFYPKMLVGTYVKADKFKTTKNDRCKDAENSNREPKDTTRTGSDRIDLNGNDFQRSPTGKMDIISGRH